MVDTVWRQYLGKLFEVWRQNEDMGSAGHASIIFKDLVIYVDIFWWRIEWVKTAIDQSYIWWTEKYFELKQQKLMVSLALVT